MKILDKVKGLFKRKPKPAPVPVVEALPEEPTGPVSELTARIEELRKFEKEAVSDSLRGKYRARREEAELWRDRIRGGPGK